MAAADPRPSRAPFSLSLCPLCPSPRLRGSPSLCCAGAVLPPIFPCALCPRLGGAHPPGVSGRKFLDVTCIRRRVSPPLWLRAAGPRLELGGEGPSPSDAEHLTPLPPQLGKSEGRLWCVSLRTAPLPRAPGSLAGCCCAGLPCWSPPCVAASLLPGMAEALLSASPPRLLQQGSQRALAVLRNELAFPRLPSA